MQDGLERLDEGMEGEVEKEFEGLGGSEGGVDGGVQNNLDPVVEGDIDSNYDSDELDTDEELNDDVSKKPKYIKYKLSEMCKEFRFKLGMEFSSIAEFKEAIREWSLLNGWGLRFKKNDKVRCRVVCDEGCEWTAFVSKVGGSLTYRLKTLNDKHTCGKTYEGKLATRKWVANKLVDTVRTNKHVSINAVIQNIRKDYAADVSVNMAYWVRRMAKEKLEGCHAQ